MLNEKNEHKQFQRKYFLGPVTKLCFLTDSLLLAGSGPVLSLFHVADSVKGNCDGNLNHELSSLWDSIGQQTIYGICPRNRPSAVMNSNVSKISDSPVSHSKKHVKLLQESISLSNEIWHLIIFGGRFASCFTLNISNPSQLLHNCKIIWERIGKSYFVAKDWILDLIWLPLEGENEFKAIAVYAHSNCISLIDMAEGVVLKNIFLEAHGILYAATFFHNQTNLDDRNVEESESVIFIACGSIMSSIIMYRVVLSHLSESVNGKNNESPISVYKIWKAHEGAIFDLQFTPYGEYLVSVSDDRTIRLWSLEAVRKDEIVPIAILFGHDARIWRVAATNYLIASVAEDASCHLWSKSKNSGSYESLASLKGHSGKHVWSVAFSPSGLMVASGGGDGAIKLWSTNGSKNLINAYSRKETLGISNTFHDCNDKWSDFDKRILTFDILGENSVYFVCEGGFLFRSHPKNTNPPILISRIDGIERYSLIKCFREKKCKSIVTDFIIIAGLNGNFVAVKIEGQNISCRKDFAYINRKVKSLYILASENGDFEYVFAYYETGAFISFSKYDLFSDQFTTHALIKYDTLPNNPIQCIDFLTLPLKDEKLIVTGSRYGFVQIFGLKNGHKLLEFEVPSDCGVNEGIACVAVLPSFSKEQTLFVGLRNGQVIRYVLSFSPKGFLDSKLVLSQKMIPGGELVRLLIMKEDLESIILVGFWKSLLFFWQYKHNQCNEMGTICCGGGSHRTWILASVSNDKIAFGYLKFSRRINVEIVPFVDLGNISIASSNSTTLKTPFHGRECRAIHFLPISPSVPQNLKMLTSGEDGLLKLWIYEVKNNSFEFVLEKKRHHSLVRFIYSMSGPSNDKFTWIFTGGGKEELFIWKLFHYSKEKDTYMSHHLQWVSSMPTVSAIHDTRLMDVNFFCLNQISSSGKEDDAKIKLLALYSDGYIRLWIFDLNSLIWATERTVYYGPFCPFKVRSSIGYRDLMHYVVVGSSKTVQLWTFHDNFPLLLSFPAHLSGINSVDSRILLPNLGGNQGKEITATYLDLLLLTGGDDGQVTLTILKLSQHDATCIYQRTLADVHHSTVTSVRIVRLEDSSLEWLSVGLDYRLTYYRADIDLFDLSIDNIRPISTCVVDVADVSAMEFVSIRKKKGPPKNIIGIVGNGLEIIYF